MRAAMPAIFFGFLTAFVAGVLFWSCDVPAVPAVCVALGAGVLAGLISAAMDHAGR